MESDISSTTEVSSPTESTPAPQTESIQTATAPEKHPLGSEDPVTSRGLEEKPAPRKVGVKSPDPSKSLLAASDTPPPVAYTPNKKFRVMDPENTESHIEYDIPDWAHGMMKDAESEKKVHDVFTKAQGLDIVKNKLQTVRQAKTEIEGKHRQLETGINELREVYQRGDLDSFFQKLAIPEQKILQFVLDKINYNELPPEQKHVLDARRQAEQKAFELEKHNQQLHGQVQEQVTRAKGIQLETALARAETKTVIDDFDARAGKPGAFRDEVIARGELAWFRSNGRIDLTPEQAVKEVLEMYGLSAGQRQMNVGTQQSAPPQAQTLAPVPVAPPKTPVIPNVGSRSQSPMKSKPRSIADLKKLADSMA